MESTGSYGFFYAIGYDSQINRRAASKGTNVVSRYPTLGKYCLWMCGIWRTIGCTALVLRKSIAIPILLISLLEILVQMYHSFCIANLLAVLGPSTAIMPSMLIIVAIFLLWLANNAKTKGWIN